MRSLPSVEMTTAIETTKAMATREEEGGGDYNGVAGGITQGILDLLR